MEWQETPTAWITELGRFSGGGNGNPLQYSCQDNSTERRALVGYSPWGHKELDRLSTHMKVKEESEKVGLKLNIKKIKIMASGPITSWEVDGETVETHYKMKTLLLWAPKSLQMVTAAMKLKDAYSLEGKL